VAPSPHGTLLATAGLGSDAVGLWDIGTGK
jgi:hypothetical protein